MPGISAFTATRREKRVTVRRAVVSALRTSDVLLVGESYQEIVRLILLKITVRDSLPFNVDDRDVMLALQKLHADGTVRVQHMDPDTWESVHIVRLLRR